MRRFLLIAVVVAVALAKPETYREKEDFQYSRSSSDDGTKAGFYGAQRGNMGGNYERAHNMDSLAQHQMGTALRQVEGEIGDVTAVDKGRVFTAGNTRGIYGKGNYNLDNLSGRNFQESGAGADSLTHSSFSNGHSGFGSHSSAAQTAGYGEGYESYKARSSGYSRGLTSAQYMEQQNREALETLHGRHAAAGGSAYSQSEFDENSAYNQAHRSRISSQNTYGATKSRVVPVRVVLRPGSSVNVPVNAEAYDNTHRSVAYDQNSVHSDAEVLSNTDSIHNIPRPIPGSKHYESEYKYRKEWEKHDALPAATPLVIPGSGIPHNSELYDDSVGRSHTANDYHDSEIGSQNKLEYETSSNHQSKYQSSYKGSHSKTAAANSNTYGTYNNLGSSADLINGRDVDASSAPKSYQSSYAYKKSWERQGDPYVITPVGGNTESQRLTAASNSQAGYRSHQYGSHAAHSRYSQSEGEDCDCDEQGNLRVVRSIDKQEDLGQQTQQVQSSDFDEQGQRPLSPYLEDFGHSQDLGQRTQNSWKQVGYFRKPYNKDNTEGLGQHTNRNEFSDLTQQTQERQSENLEDLGQQVQHGWDESANLGQQTQNGWYAENISKKPSGKVDNFSGRPENAWHAEDLFKQQQQIHGNVNNVGTLNSQITRGHTETIGDSSNEQTHKDWYAADLFQKPQDKLDTTANIPKINGKLQGQMEYIGQQTHNNWGDVTNTGQQTQGVWHAEEMGQSNYNHWRQVENGKTAEKPSLDEISIQRQPATPSSASQNKPAFNTQDLFKPVWEPSEQSSSGFGKVDDIFKDQNLYDGKSHSHGADEYSFQHSSQNWGNAHGESSRSVQNHHEVQYQFTASDLNRNKLELTTRKQSTDDSVLAHTTESNKSLYPRLNNNEATRATWSGGRGDVEAGDSYHAFLGIRPTPRTFTTQTSIVQHKPYKTPAEIETLSLIKKNEKNSDTEEQLSVVGLHQGQATSQRAGKLDTENRRLLNSHNGNIEQQSQTTWNTNDKLHENRAQTEDVGQQFAQSTLNRDSKFQQTQDQMEDIGQQVQTSWNTNDQHQSRAQAEDIGQQVVQGNWNTDDTFQQTQDQSENLGQQVQTSWNHDNLQQSQRQSEDLGQQIQTGWSHNEKITQQGDGQRITDEFYSEHHQLPKAQEESLKIESHTVTAPPEMTTKPPGFWKRVGGKVTSWFGR